MSIKNTDNRIGKGAGVSFEVLSEFLGTDAADALVSRLDQSLRKGHMILGKNVREARSTFATVKTAGAQFVIPGGARSVGDESGRLGDNVVILNLEDLGAIVTAVQERFDWAAAFAPTSGLPAAETMPDLLPGAEGDEALRF